MSRGIDEVRELERRLETLEGNYAADEGDVPALERRVKELERRTDIQRDYLGAVFVLVQQFILTEDVEEKREYIREFAAVARKMDEADRMFPEIRGVEDDEEY